MKILLKWINEYVNISGFSVEQISNALVEVGFEVESAVYLGESVNGVKTCKILSSTSITEKLKYCEISFGGGKTINVVCGAPNVVNGMITAYATVGTQVKGKTIQVAQIQGHTSEGMLCSAAELNLNVENLDFSLNNEGILSFPPNTRLNMDLDKLLSLDDYLLDVSITANRPDCQSIYGIARELATKLGRRLKPLKLDYKTTAHNGEFMPSVTIKDKDLCPIYTGSRIKNVVVTDSPHWIKARLAALGHKPINNIVDITNYVLLETGQPLHAFDLSNISKEIIVRLGKKGEKIETLDGNNCNIESNLVIADAQKPLAIAGIMGGSFSGIKNTTADVFLESARFARGHIRLGARSLGISTDSSKRYEKGVDFDSVEVGRKRALCLISQLKAGEIVDITTTDCDAQQIKEAKNRTIFCNLKQLVSLLGIKIPPSFTKKTLTSLGFAIKNQKMGFEVTVPLNREDIDSHADIAEEIIRFYGYDKLDTQPVDTLPMTVGGISKSRKAIDKAERICLAFGLCEVKNFSFVAPSDYKKLLLPKPEQVTLLNPLGEEYSTMRTQLLTSVLATAALNLNRKNNSFRIFEIDNIFEPQKNQLPQEKKTLCAVFCRPDDDFFSIKAFVSALITDFGINFEVIKSEKPYFHPNISAEIVADGKNLGSLGKIHPTVAQSLGIERDIYAAQIDIDALINHKRPPIKFSPLPKFPSVERDLAIVIDENVSIAQIFSTINSAITNGIICQTELLEVYCGHQVEQGKKSVLVRLNLTNKEKTMTESEISAITTQAVKLLEQQLSAQLRQ